MIINHHITNTPIVTDYKVSKPETKLIDRHLGGIDLQDTSEGLEYQVWTIYYEDGWIKLKSELNNKLYDLLQASGVSEVALAFDSSMTLSYAFVINARCFLRFYDSSLQAYTTLEIPDSRNIRLCFDDTREFNINNADIVCAYINFEKLKLCYRLSRDRFSIERELANVTNNSRLVRIGMSEGLRLQFKMIYI